MQYHARLYLAHLEGKFLHQPSALDDDRLPPSVEGLGWVIQAFQFLSKRRRQSASAGLAGGSIEIGYIQASEIAAYCDLFQIADLEKRDLLTYLIDRMDTEFVKLKTPKKKPGGPPAIDHSVVGKQK